MNKIEEFAQEWAEFNKYQDRIRLRNKYSDEYVKFQQENTWDRYNVDWYMFEVDKILEKDLFKNTFEGMLDWVNAGKPK